MSDDTGDAARTDELPTGDPAKRWAPIVAGVTMIALLGVAAFLLGRSDASNDVDTSEARSTSPTGSTAETIPPTGSIAETIPPTDPPMPTTAEVTTEVPATPQPIPSTQAAAATYSFPIIPASSASPSSSHHDYPASDIFAPCGSEVVATTSGTIQEVTLVDQWRSDNDRPELRGGLSYSLVGDDGVRYYGSHLLAIDASVRPGTHLTTGQRIGAVGETGNAAGTGCHLHFGVSKPCGPGDVLRRRGEIWPQPYLRSWKAGEQRSPLPEVPSAAC